MFYYLAKASFYDVQTDFNLCVGKNKKKVIKSAVEILKREHEKSPFPLSFFGLKQGKTKNKITSHYIKVEEIECI